MPEETQGFETSSFRDPAGYIIDGGDAIYRVVTEQGANDWRELTNSGLYDELLEAGAILPHEQVDEHPLRPSGAAFFLRTERLPFFSYPYEWSFLQLRDAALRTLDVLRRALRRGMILKDGSAFNVTFQGSHPLFIDILSFTRYTSGEPWLGYRQFCEHFLAPLLLSDYTGDVLSRWMQADLDGLPLSTASKLLPLRSRLRFSEALHIHLHAGGIRRYSGLPRDTVKRARATNVSALVASLHELISRLPRKKRSSHWTDYYESTVYTAEEEAEKQRFVEEFLRSVAPRSLWDLGCNTGKYAGLAASMGIPTVAMDADAAVIDALHAGLKAKDNRYLHPIVMNLARPSPRLGWAHGERLSLADRGPADAALYLGLVHHLRFADGIPLDRQYAYLASIARHVLLEWIPPDDANVLRMTRGSIRASLPYSEAIHERALLQCFTIEKTMALGHSGRVLYQLKNRIAR